MAVERILVVRLSSMGDVIHTLPAVATLKHSFPGSHVTWLVRPRWMPLLEGNPFIDEVVPVERTLAASWVVTGNLRRRHFDLAVDFQGLIQTAMLAAAVRPQRLAGYSRAHARERLAAWFYSAEIAVKAPHAVDRAMELSMGVGAANPLRVFPLPQGVAEGKLPEGKFVLASPLAGWGAKQWPLEHWSQLAKLLDYPLVLNGPPEAQAALDAVPGVLVHLSGMRGLIDATRRAHAVVGVDSGPMHLAAALNKPGAALFGPTDPSRHGPYGGSLRVVRLQNAITSYQRTRQPAASMQLITPEMVAEAIRACLKEAATDSAPAGFPA